VVTFKDDQNQFGSGLAVALPRRYSRFDIQRILPSGQIVDADMIFNPNKTYRTQTQGATGTDIGSVATHEAGHLYGISHTAIRSSTLSYVLPSGTNATSLESDDELAFLKAYADSATREDATRLGGTVTDGQTGAAVPGDRLLDRRGDGRHDGATALPDRSTCSRNSGNVLRVIYQLMVHRRSVTPVTSTISSHPQR
jgi:hypothetical protein